MFILIVVKAGLASALKPKSVVDYWSSITCNH